MARRFICLLCLLFLFAVPAMAEGSFTLDVDALDMNRLNSDSYVADHLSSSESGLRVRKTVSTSSEVAANVRLTLTQMNTQTLIYDRDWGYVSGTFDSGVIYLPYAGSGTTPYLVTLYIGEYVYAMPYMQLQPRLTQNGACTYGVRLRDLDASLGSDWLMGTVVDLDSLSGRRTVDVIASNSYVIGQATLERNGGKLCVNLSFAPSADVDVSQVSLYVATDAQPYFGQSYSVGQWIDVSRADTALIYLPMQVSYDPSGLPRFSYNANSADLQEMIRLWRQDKQTTTQPDTGWMDDGWNTDDGWSDNWNSNADGWL